MTKKEISFLYSDLIFQIRVNNYLYLDRTGLFMSSTDDFLKGWQGDVSGYRFTSKSGRIVGFLSMNELSMSSNRFGTTSEFEDCVVKIMPTFLEIYGSMSVTRIGFRIVSILESEIETAVRVINEAHGIESPDSLSEIGKLEGIDLLQKYKTGDNSYVNLKTYHGRRIQDKSEKNLPESGLVVDTDHYWQYEEPRILDKSLIGQIKNDLFKNAHVFDEAFKQTLKGVNDGVA